MKNHRRGSIVSMSDAKMGNGLSYTNFRQINHAWSVKTSVPEQKHTERLYEKGALCWDRQMHQIRSAKIPARQKPKTKKTIINK